MKTSATTLAMILTVLAALTAAAPTSAQAFRAINTLDVVPIDRNRFEVIGRPRAIKNDYWCAAGDYLRRQLQLPWSTKIYVVTGIQRSEVTGARSAVQFTLAPEAIGLEPYSSSWVSDVLKPGYARDVTAAFHHCDRRLFPAVFF